MPHKNKSKDRRPRVGQIQQVIDALLGVAMALGRTEIIHADAKWQPEIKAMFGRLDEGDYLRLTASYGRIDVNARYEKPKGKLNAHLARLASSRRGAKFDQRTRKYVRGSDVGPQSPLD